MESEEIKKKKHKKVGRPKKRGPKKKRKSRAKPKPKVYHYKRYDWKIISASCGKQKEYFGKFHNEADARNRFEELRQSNNDIIFPRKVKNSYTIHDSKDEYILLEKNRNGDKVNTSFRNEYGILVENITNNPLWVIADKCPRFIEETFWVYGYDPRCDRKTFLWIYENIIKGKIMDSTDIKQIIINKNKVVIKSDNEDLDFITCKIKGDAIRFYNLVEEYVKKDKLSKQIIFMGDWSPLSDKRRELDNALLKLTGWGKKKIILSSTRS